MAENWGKILDLVPLAVIGLGLLVGWPYIKAILDKLGISPDAGGGGGGGGGTGAPTVVYYYAGNPPPTGTGTPGTSTIDYIIKYLTGSPNNPPPGPATNINTNTAPSPWDPIRSVSDLVGEVKTVGGFVAPFVEQIFMPLNTLPDVIGGFQSGGLVGGAAQMAIGGMKTAFNIGPVETAIYNYASGFFGGLLGGGAGATRDAGAPVFNSNLTAPDHPGAASAPGVLDYLSGASAGLLQVMRSGSKDPLVGGGPACIGTVCGQLVTHGAEGGILTKEGPSIQEQASYGAGGSSVVREPARQTGSSGSTNVATWGTLYGSSGPTVGRTSYSKGGKSITVGRG